MASVIGLLMSLLNIALGTFGLFLVLRMLLPVFRMRWDHPVMKVVMAITDPVVSVTSRWLGIPSYGSAYRSTGNILTFILGAAFELYGMALFVRIIFSWIRVPYTSPVSRFLWDITEPLLGPIRSAMPPLPGIDISPLVAFFILRLLQQVVFALLSWIF